MSPLLLSLLIGSFVVGLLIHVIIWRVRRPVDDAAALMHLVVTLPAILSGIGIWSCACLESPAGATGLAVMFHVGTGFTYMSLYTAAQAASPTSLVLLALAREKNGLTELEVRDLFSTDLLSGKSVQSAIDEEILSVEGEKLSLAPRGASLIRVCNGLRSILALPSGRG